MSDLKKNISYNVIYQIISVILPLISSPIISRRLGPEMTGVYSYTYSIAYYFVLFGQLGIGLYGNRTIAQHRDNSEELSKTFWSLYPFQLFTSTLMAAAYCCYALLIVRENEVIVWIQLLIVVASLFDVTWFLFGIEEFKRPLLRNFIVKIAGFILIVFVVKTPYDLWKYTLIMSSATMIGQIIMWPYILKIISFKRPSHKDIAIHVKPNLILFLPSIAISIYTVMDKIMVGYFRPKSEVGYYEYAEKIIAVLNSLVTAIEKAFIPRMSKLFFNKDSITTSWYIRKTIYYISLIAPPIVLGFASISRLFAPLYWGRDYVVSGTLILILAPGTLFSIIGSVFRAEYIIPNEMDKEYVGTLFIGAFVNLIGNYFLIMRWGVTGAAISTTFAEAAITVSQLWLVRKVLCLGQYFKDNYTFYIYGITMFCFVYLLSIKYKTSIVYMIVLIVIGAIIYSVPCIIQIVRSKKEMDCLFRENIMCIKKSIRRKR